MENQYTFEELISAINKGEISEGTEFSTKSGESLVFKYGSLTWMTATKYLTAPISVTSDTLAEVYTVVEKKTKPISFYEAVEILLEEKEDVMAIVDSNEYTLKEISDIDTVISKEFFHDLYKGKFYVALPKEESK